MTNKNPIPGLLFLCLFMANKSVWGQTGVAGPFYGNNSIYVSIFGTGNCNPDDAKPTYTYQQIFGVSDYSDSYAGDSANIQNFVTSIPIEDKWATKAGRSTELYVEINTFDDSVSIEDSVTIHVGTLARNRDAPPNPHIDTSYRVAPEFILGYKYKFTTNIRFARGSIAGHLMITIPLKSNTVSDQSTRIFDQIIPFIIEGPLDEQVPIIDTTSEPQIPYLVLHDPPGDKSTTTIASGWSNCRIMQEQFTIDSSTNTFGSAKLGFKGQIGFIYNLEVEIFAEFAFETNQGNYMMQSRTAETCVSTTSSITTSNLPMAAQSDLFIGYGMDLAVAVSPNLKLTVPDGCSYEIDTGLVYLPIEGTYRPFSLTEFQIAEKMKTLQDSLPFFTTTEDSANAMYQINVWQQVLDINAYNKSHTDFGPPLAFGGGQVQEATKIVEFSQGNSITVDHYIENQKGFQFGAYFAGSGFGGGFKMRTTKHFGKTSSNTSIENQTISYHLEDDDAGDLFTVSIGRDSMYGTPVFKLDENYTQSSCPYEGGKQRDQISISASSCGQDGPYLDKIYLDNIDSGPGGEGKIFVKICNNNPTEARQISWRLDANPKSLGYQFNGSTNQIQDLGFLAAADCDTFELIVMKINSNLQYNNLTWRVYPSCLNTDPALESYLLQESDIINTNFTFGGSGNYPLGDRDCDGIINAKDCGVMEILTLNGALGPLSGDYYANQKIIVQGSTQINAGANISWHAPEVEMVEVAVPQTTLLAIDPGGDCP